MSKKPWKDWPMEIERSEEYWVRLADSEPDCPISAGVPDYQASPVGRLGKPFLWLRAKFAWSWRIGLISRGTAFRWEMDLALGELSRRAKQGPSS